MNARPHLAGTLLPTVLLVLVGCGGVTPPSTNPPAAAAAPEAAPPPAAPPAAAEPAAEDHKNTVRWSTASEVDNFGFDVYRGDAEDGPWTRLTANPIPGAGTSDEPHQYSYVDRDIDPTRAYYYWVESISLGGVREKFTPVIRAKPKLPTNPTP